MKQKTGILKLLNIQAGEGKAVLLLMIYSFFMGLSLAFFFTSTNAIFLTYFEPKMIPVSFIASGIAVYLAWLLLSLIDKRLSVSNQLVVKLLFITISVVFISVAESIAETGWLAFFMFTWVRVIVYISLVTFWGVAAKLFNIRQGKRIFGLISTGEVISLIIGYFSIPLLLRFMKTTDLLFLAAFSLIVCVVVVILIIKNFKDKLEPVKQKPTEKAVKNEEKTSWKYVFSLHFPDGITSNFWLSFY
jgi:predicted MFS family arabinose efflux permease